MLLTADSGGGDMPSRIEPYITMDELDEPIELVKGPLHLKGPTEVTIASDLTFQWSPSRRVVFDGECSAGDISFKDMEADWELQLDGVDSNPPVLLLETSPLTTPVPVRGIVNGVTGVGQSPFERLRFSLANFPEYIGEPLTWGEGPSRGASRDGLHGSDDLGSWAINTVPETRELAKQARKGAGFVITHVGEWIPASGSLTSAEAGEILSMLHIWFGFLRGAWSGPLFLQGLCDGLPQWRQIAQWTVEDGREVSTWMPSVTPISLAGLFAGFSLHWRDERWRVPLRTAVWWLVQANADATGTESRIVLAQVALELLAWVHVVEVEQMHTRSDFERLSAAGRLRALLQSLAIPTGVPDYMPALAQLCDREAFDGPGVITRVRNALVHASENKRAMIAALKGEVRYECAQLALQYVDLVLLAVCGYEGYYAQRGFRGWKGDDEVLVPWADSA